MPSNQPRIELPPEVAKQVQQAQQVQASLLNYHMSIAKDLFVGYLTADVIRGVRTIFTGEEYTRQVAKRAIKAAELLVEEFLVQSAEEKETPTKEKEQPTKAPKNKEKNAIDKPGPRG